MTGVAVVMTCYNLGRTLDEAIESVRRQTRPAAEMVVVDDGSDDALTHHVVDRLITEGVCIVRTANQGVAAARNLGVRLTSSPYVTLLDADDVLHPDYIARLAAVLDSRSEIDFVTCALEAFGEADYVWAPPPIGWVDALVSGGPHVSSMFRRALWERVRGFDPSLPGYEDTEFWLRALEGGSRGETLPDALVRYRVRAGSRYRRAIQPPRYVDTMEAIYRKRPDRIAAAGRVLLRAKDQFIEAQRAHQRGLHAKQGELEAAIAEVRHEIERARTALTDAGILPIDWGDLRRVTPVSPVWGLDRGKPLDRIYIERFLHRHRHDIRGAILEVGDAGYSRAFGETRVTSHDVVDIDARNPSATIVADLACADGIPPGSFDCFIMTQTLHLIYDIHAVLSHAYRVLKPGGVLLCTLPSVSRISHDDRGLEGGDFWRFTEAAARAAVSHHFPPAAVEVTTHGNLKTSAAFLHGLTESDLPDGALEESDPWHPLICCVRAVKPRRGDGGLGRRSIQPGRGAGDVGGNPGAVLLYHRVGARVPDTHGLSVRTEDFRAHLRILAERYRPMALPELVSAARSGLPAGAVAVTFDDGYLEMLTHVSPILLEYGIPATFFVNTDRLDDPHEFWWDVLERVFVSPDEIPPVLDLFEDGRWRHSTVTAAERSAAMTSLFALLFPLSSREREAIMTRVTRWSGLALAPRDTHRAMTGDEIRELGARPGHAVGAHTVHHLSLLGQSEETQWREVCESKQRLERLVGWRIDALAYPYGQFDGTTVRVARQAGFSIAATVEARAVHPGVDPLLVPRIEVKSGDGTALEALLQGLIDRPGVER